MKGTKYSNTRRKRPTEIDIHDKRGNSEKNSYSFSRPKHQNW